ncbi:hypothetical protein HYV83_02545 [Candidatus Woesearchaeota archaeon]|nr:hypothetical protein [Candidatus Woesearchaeota archaeon]
MKTRAKTRRLDYLQSRGCSSKKGISVWISWVLLTAFVVFIGTFVLQWSKSHTTEVVEDLTEKGEILTLCQETGISIVSYCQKPQTLNINVTNNNNRKVDGLKVRAFDIYNNPQGGEKNVSIVPQKTMSIEVVKQGVLKRAEVMPIIVVGKKRAVCQSRKVTVESIDFC